jgi:ABC-type transport system substrate-binding protein
MSMDQLIWVQPSPADNVNYSLVTGGSGNFTGYDNSQVNKLALQASESYNVAQQDQYYGELYKIVAEDAPWVWLDTYNFIGLHTQRVMNYHYRAELGNYYDRLWVSS